MEITELPISNKIKDLIIKNGISELYPPQLESINAGILDGKNLVLASPTASGKTLVAEICCFKHILEKNGKVIYLAPFKALANEKFDELCKYSSLEKTNGKKVSIGISTGDYDNYDPKLKSKDVVVTTNEKADALLRHRVEWLNEISLVIVDEAHLINEAERGPTLEVVLARLMQLNPSIQILALSATMGNVNEIASWIKGNFVISEWRPVTLKEGVLLQNEVLFRNGDLKKIERKTNNETVNLALNTIKTGGQVLVFAPTRNGSVYIAKKISEQSHQSLSKPLKRTLDEEGKNLRSLEEKTRLGETLIKLIKNGAAFHHAGLTGRQRKIIENLFRQSKIKILTATPTLAFGVNLPARTVIIQDYRRYQPSLGFYPISVLEYKQMAGRAGRPKYDKTGEAVLIAKTTDESDYLMENFIRAIPERIWSRLGVERILRGHVLATIASNFAHTKKEIYDFFSKTFYAYQYDLKTIEFVISKILKYLEFEKMINVSGDKLYTTKFGKKISDLYIDPRSAVIIRDSLEKPPICITYVSVLHLITHTPDMKPIIRPYNQEIENLAILLEKHRDELFIVPPNEWDDHIAYSEFLGEIKTALILNSWVNEETEEDLLEKYKVQPGDLYKIVENGKWLLHAIYNLGLLVRNNEILHIVNELRERVSKGIKKELISIAKLQGVGRIRSRILFNAGYKTINDLKGVDVEKLTNLPMIGPAVAKKIIAQLGGKTKKEKWENLRDKEWSQKAITDF